MEEVMRRIGERQSRLQLSASASLLPSRTHDEPIKPHVRNKLPEHPPNTEKKVTPNIGQIVPKTQLDLLLGP
eukprot:2108413-Amphidinium_carterae.2